MRAGRVMRWIGGLGGALALAVVPFGTVGAAPAAMVQTDGGTDAVEAVGADQLPEPEPLPRSLEQGSRADGQVADPVEVITEAMEVLGDSPQGTRRACAPAGQVGACVVARPIAGPAVADSSGPDAAAPFTAAASERALAASAVRPSPSTDPSPFPSSLVSSWTPLCTGTGSDDFRVQPVYAYDPAWGPPGPSYVAAIKAAMVNADLTFSQSAAATGGQRRIRYRTTHGLPGCALVAPTVVPVTTGLSSFSALVDELINNGAVSGDPSTRVKYLIWTDGDLYQPKPGEPDLDVCGMGWTYEEDFPGVLDNYNIVTSYAAVNSPCWDINGGGSAPAHELMHTLGAVQDSAPHYDGNGHCTDDHDNMCYGSSTVVVPGCTNYALEALFDCHHDDYFHTSPANGSYLCRSWNTARSPYLSEWDSGYQPLGAIPSVWAVPSENRIEVHWSPPSSCPSASAYRIEVSGWGSDVVLSSELSYLVDVPPGDRTITVTPYRDGQWWPNLARSVVASSVAEVNDLPVGGMVLSLNQGHNYGLLAWAIDPEADAPPRMRVTVEGVSSQEYDWNYVWGDMPAYTGVNDRRSLVYLAQLPSGTRQVCFDALDPQGGGWTNLGCTIHTVK